MQTWKKSTTHRTADAYGDNIMTNGSVNPADIFFTDDMNIVMQRSCAVAPVITFFVARVTLAANICKWFLCSRPPCRTADNDAGE